MRALLVVVLLVVAGVAHAQPASAYPGAGIAGGSGVDRCYGKACVVQTLATGYGQANRIDITGAGTGADPSITAAGTDSDVDLVLSGQGAGDVLINGELRTQGNDIILGSGDIKGSLGAAIDLDTSISGAEIASSGTGDLVINGTAISLQGGPTTAVSVSATSFSSSQASGSNAIAVTTNGARVDLGTGASDHLTSDGTSISTAGSFTAGANLFSANGIISTPIALRVSANTALPTCDASNEGRLYRKGGGGSGGVRTSLCLCTNDGAGTAATNYDWINIRLDAASQVGTETTCP
jgi:hypothetical protein